MQNRIGSTYKMRGFQQKLDSGPKYIYLPSNKDIRISEYKYYINSTKEVIAMAEQSIDFGNFSKKILINPSVPLQVLDIFYRNAHRVQATILGKIYATAIQIVEVVPYALCETSIKKLDFAEHSKAIENIKTVYPNLQVIGVAVTDLTPNKDLAVLHTMYANKDSEFKAHGILTHPIIVSIGTTIQKDSENFNLDAYCFNQPYLFCKDFMGITSFQKLEVTLSFGDSDVETMAPLFEAMNDQDEFVPDHTAKQLVETLVQNLKRLKLKCEEVQNEDLRVQIRRFVDQLKREREYNMEELSYLLEYASLQRLIGNKLNKIESETRN